MVMEYRKVYVELLLHVDTDGNYKPVELIWEDGRTYHISKVIEKRIAPTRYVGSILTTRFTVLINGYVRELYFEKTTNKWFVETPI